MVSGHSLRDGGRGDSQDRSQNICINEQISACVIGFSPGGITRDRITSPKVQGSQETCPQVPANTGLPWGSLQPRIMGASGKCLAKGSWQDTNYGRTNLEMIVYLQ